MEEASGLVPSALSIHSWSNMEVISYIALVAEWYASLAFLASVECVNVADVEHVVISMTVDMESVVDNERSSICRMILTIWWEWCLIWSLWSFPDCINCILLFLLGTDKGFTIASLDTWDVWDFSTFEHALNAFSHYHKVREARWPIVYHSFKVRGLQSIYEHVNQFFI